MISYKVSQESGFTLIELLISLMLGLMIIGAVGAVYIGSKRTYSERDTLSLLQENGRIAVQLLEYGISPAGYPAVDDLDPFIQDSTADGASGAESDSVGIRFFPVAIGDQTGYLRDCLGNSKKDGEFIENRFSVKDGKLRCEGSSNPGNPQPIAEGVENMQVEYGVLDEDNLLELFTATSLEASSDYDWSDVVSVKIDLTIEGPKENDPFKGKERNFSTMIPLRNRLPLID